MSMKVLLRVAISVWVVFLAPSAWSSLTFDVGLTIEDPSIYSNFLADLRNEAKDGATEYHGIPALPEPPSPPTYLLVELIDEEKLSIILALNRSNLFVVGYRDKYDGMFRAHFFPDAPSNAKDVLFREAVGENFRKTISFKSNYPATEAKAKGNRTSIRLGIQLLENRIGRVYGIDLSIPTNVTRQAEFLLISMQMVSEATQFNYIEDQVLSNLYTFKFALNSKVINLEGKWGKISKKIAKAPDDGTIDPPLVLEDESGGDWIVTKVEQIEPDVALLNYPKADDLTIPSLIS